MVTPEPDPNPQSQPEKDPETDPKPDVDSDKDEDDKNSPTTYDAGVLTYAGIGFVALGGLLIARKKRD